MTIRDVLSPDYDPATMTGEELQAIRKLTYLSTTQMARAAGYGGSNAIAAMTIRKYESGQQAVPRLLARLAVMFLHHGVPEKWIEGAPGRQKPGPKPKTELESDQRVLRQFADLDWDEKDANK